MFVNQLLKPTYHPMSKDLKVSVINSDDRHLLRRKNELDFIIESGEIWANLWLSSTDSDRMTIEEKECSKRCAEKSYIASKILMHQVANGIAPLSVKKMDEMINKIE